MSDSPNINEMIYSLAMDAARRELALRADFAALVKATADGFAMVVRRLEHEKALSVGGVARDMLNSARRHRAKAATTPDSSDARGWSRHAECLEIFATAIEGAGETDAA